MDSEGDKPPPIVEREIPYRMRWSTLARALSLFPVLTAISVWMLLSGQILVIKGIDFGQTGSRICVLIMLLMFGSGLIWSLYMLARRFTDPPRVLIIRNDAIVIPPGRRRRRMAW